MVGYLIMDWDVASSTQEPTAMRTTATREIVEY